MSRGWGWGQRPSGPLPMSRRRRASTVDAAWRLGVRFFDTAPLYGSGLAEERLDGRSLPAARGYARRLGAFQPGRRAGFPGRATAEAVFDFAEGIRRSLMGNLERLGLDAVDARAPRPEKRMEGSTRDRDGTEPRRGKASARTWCRPQSPSLSGRHRLVLLRAATRCSIAPPTTTCCRSARRPFSPVPRAWLRLRLLATVMAWWFVYPAQLLAGDEKKPAPATMSHSRPRPSNSRSGIPR